MTHSIGPAIGHLGPRSATSALATPEDRGAGHAFEREFERAMVETWFAAGPVAHLEATHRGGPAGRRSVPTAPRPDAVRGATSDASVRADHPGDDPTVRAGPPRRGTERVDRRPTSAEATAAAASPGAGHDAPAMASVSRSTPPPRATSLIESIVPAGPEGPQAGPAGSARPLAGGPPTGLAAVTPPPSTTQLPRLVADDTTRHVPESRTSAAHEPPPIRLHVEADADGARVWLGVDRAARASSSAVLEHVRDALHRSGIRMRGVVVNGGPLEVPALSFPPRQDF